MLKKFGKLELRRDLIRKKMSVDSMSLNGL